VLIESGRMKAHATICFVCLSLLLFCETATAFSGESGEIRQLTVLPVKYPQELAQSGTSGDVQVEFKLSKDGVPYDTRIVSAPSPFDDEVLRALPLAVFTPLISSDCRPNDDPWRQDLTFRIVDGKASVAVGDPVRYRKDRRGPAPYAERLRYFPDSIARRRIVKTQRNPGFPRVAIRRGVTSGTTIFALSVAPNGKVLQTEVVFAYPKGWFEEKSQEALATWEFEPPADWEDVRLGKVCVQTLFKWDGITRGRSG
jgi:TonB family protein